MKKTLLALVMVGCSFWNACADDAATFMAELEVSAMNGCTNVYTWTPPRQILVQGEDFSLVNFRTNNNEVLFKLISTGGVVVAGCQLGRAETSSTAEHRLCEILTFCVTMPIVDYAKEFIASRHADGNLTIRAKPLENDAGPRLEQHGQTKGNVFLVIRGYDNLPEFPGEDIAAALLGPSSISGEGP